MITGYRVEAGSLVKAGEGSEGIAAAQWIDLLQPTREEAKAVADHLGLDLPSRDDMEEIEFSSRLYMESGAAFMTATVLAQTEEDDSRVAKPISFILTPRVLVTIRHSSPKPFNHFIAHADRASVPLSDSASVLVGLLDAIVDRLADILELVGAEVEEIGADVFEDREKNGRRQTRHFKQALLEIGSKAAITSNVRESLTSLQRLFTFLATVRLSGKNNELRAAAKVLTRDAASLSEHVSFLSSKINFLLDATLGLINLEQNNTMKIFSVAAVMFLPPTLIASIYGMNFEHMPELDNHWGYYVVLCVMAVVTAIPYIWFRRKGWL